TTPAYPRLCRDKADGRLRRPSRDGQRALRIVALNTPQMCLQLSSGRVPDASQHHIRIDVGDLLQRQPPARRIPGGNPGCHREDAECGDLHVDAEKLALADPVFELFLKHVLILVAKRRDARPLSAIQAPKLAVADENLFRPLTVKLDVVINEE